jgi:hypothetical protein
MQSPSVINQYRFSLSPTIMAIPYLLSTLLLIITMSSYSMLLEGDSSLSLVMHDFKVFGIRVLGFKL